MAEVQWTDESMFPVSGSKGHVCDIIESDPSNPYFTIKIFKHTVFMRVEFYL